jgi:hypothetical protein
MQVEYNAFIVQEPGAEMRNHAVTARDCHF